MKTTIALCFFSFISGLFFKPPKEDLKMLERFNNAKDSIYETKRIN